MAVLPTSRIKTIMKSTADVDAVNKEAVYTLTRATEMFLKYLATEAYKDTIDKGTLNYKNIANVVHKHERLEFLRDIVPKKITVKQYREMMARKKNLNVSESSSKSESSSGVSDGETDISTSSQSSDNE